MLGTEWVGARDGASLSQLQRAVRAVGEQIEITKAGLARKKLAEMIEKHGLEMKTNLGLTGRWLRDDDAERILSTGFKVGA